MGAQAQRPVIVDDAGLYACAPICFSSMSPPRHSRLETAFLWTWALLFCAGILAGVVVFGLEKFAVPLSHATKKQLISFLAFTFVGSVFLLPLWMATTASGFFDAERVRLSKSVSCFGCWLGMVVPAIVIGGMGVVASDVLPSWLVVAFGWLWRIVLALSLLPWLLGALSDAWKTGREGFKRLKRWLASVKTRP